MNDQIKDPVRAPWSLKRRMMLWITAGVITLLTLGLGGTAWFMSDAFRRELDALAVEELAEATILCHAGQLDRNRFADIGKRLDDEHPGVRVSLRLWRTDESAPWLRAGPQRAPEWPEEAVVHERKALSPSRLVRLIGNDIRIPDDSRASGDQDVRLELMLDGTPRAEEILRVGSAFFVLALLGGGCALVGGALFANRVAALLGQVADSAGAARLDAETAVHPPEGAPIEIHAVSTAFESSVEGMRGAHARNLLLTAGLAHELRSPIQNMVSEAEITLLNDREPGDYREVLHNQLDDLRALALVVDNLVTLTALRDAGRLPRQETFDLGEETRMRLSKETLDAGRRDIELAVQQSGDMEIHGDREALILMIRNLVGNAIRWAPEHSTVTVLLEGGHDEFRIVVQDRGPGVPDEDRNVIFEAFRRGSTPLGSRAGYGLGLALARAAARAHDGEISVERAACGGASFEVRIPRNETVRARTGVPRSATGS